MVGLSLVFPESIDDVLTAVQETPRGRWFLEAYADRVKNDGTVNILSAIAKLENNLNAIAAGGAEAGLLQQARSAIATAKREIALLEPKTAQLSAEGQLFAKLAELSRQAFSATAEPSVANGIDRVFKLVTELDLSLTLRQTHAVEAAPPKPAIQYFKQDEAVFEPAPAPVFVAVAKPAAIAEVPNRGAKLVIQRVNSAKPETVMTVEEPSVTPSMPLSEPKSEEPSRIVIIRRKADEASDVPMFDDAEMETVNAA